MPKTISKDYDEKQGSILFGATKVFAQIGFDRASMNQVASECGVSKAALYHYFPSKNAILYAILDQNLRGLRDHILGQERGEMDAERYLHHIVEEILVFYRGNDEVHKLQMHALGQLDKVDQKQLRGYMRSLVDHVAKAIRATHPPAFENDASRLRIVTMSLFGMLNWYYTWNSGRGVSARKHYAREATNILLCGIYGSEQP